MNTNEASSFEAAIKKLKTEDARELESAHAEIARLRGLLMEQVEDSPLEKLEVSGGEIEVQVRPPWWLLQHIGAGFLGGGLGGAPNWRSYEIGPISHPSGRLLVTVRRVDGDSPEDTVEKQRKMIEKLLEAICWADRECFKGHQLFRTEDYIAVDEAKNMIDPFRKVSECYAH